MMTTPTSNISIDEFSKYVRLPQSVLYQHKITESRYNDSSCILIPYIDQKRQTIQTQIRLSNNGSDKWSWSKYNRPVFYGLHLLPSNKKIEKLLIVEGATDVIVANYNNVYAVGVAGANNFKPEMLNDLPLDNIESYYILNEQDDGGKTLIESFSSLIESTSAFTDKCKVFNLGEHKDIVDLWKSFEPEGITSNFAKALDTALNNAVNLGAEEELFPDEVPATIETPATTPATTATDSELSENSVAETPPPAPITAPARQLDSLLYEDSLLGDIVNKINPTTESNEHGLFAHLLAFCGHLVGNKPHILLGSATTIKANLFLGVLGKSGSAGRKGTSRNDIETVLYQSLGELYVTNGIRRGFSSGEVLVKMLSYPENEDGEVMEIPQEIINIDEEFEKLLMVKGRSNSIVQQIMQTAYEGKALDRISSSETNRAIDYHFSYVGHMTPSRMQHYFNTDSSGVGSGFYSRFIYLETWKDKQIYAPMTIDWYEDGKNILQLFKEQLDWARSQNQMTLANDSEKIYREVKNMKSPVESWNSFAETTSEILGNRYDYHVLKLALIFALFDTAQNAEIQPKHMAQALKIMESSEKTIARTLRTATGDPKADALISKIKALGGSVSVTQIYNDLAKGNKAKKDFYLELLHQYKDKYFKLEIVNTATNKKETWSLIE